MPAGSVLDAGAFDGRWSEFYASLDAGRLVYAIDPAQSSIDRIELVRARCPNVQPVLGALDSSSRLVHPHRRINGYTQNVHAQPTESTNQSSDADYPAFALDDLAVARGLRFGFNAWVEMAAELSRRRALLRSVTPEARAMRRALNTWAAVVAGRLALRRLARA